MKNKDQINSQLNAQEKLTRALILLFILASFLGSLASYHEIRELNNKEMLLPTRPL